MVQSEKKRVTYIDIFRGIGILLMIMGHIGFGKSFDHYIHAFHMPMFFFASGYFFKRKQPFSTFLVSKTKSLLVPYLFYTMLFYIIWRLFYNEPKESLFEVLTFMNSTGFIAAALWFLTALFFSNCIYWLVRTLFSTERTVSVIVVLIALGGNCLHFIYKRPCVFAFDAAMVGTGMMHAGFLLKKYDDIMSKIMKEIPLFIIIIGLAGICMLIFINPIVNMRLGVYGIIPLFWINALLNSMLFWGLSYKLDEVKKGHWMIEIIQKIGKSSMSFLCLNQIVIYFVFKIFPTRSNSGLFTLAHNIFALLIVICILYFAAYLREVAYKKVTSN